MPLSMDSGMWTICPCRLNTKGFSSKFPDSHPAWQASEEGKDEDVGLNVNKDFLNLVFGLHSGRVFWLVIILRIIWTSITILVAFIQTFWLICSTFLRSTVYWAGYFLFYKMALDSDIKNSCRQFQEANLK